MEKKLTKAIVDQARPRAQGYFIWDSEVRGFGVRVHPSGRKTFVYQYRFEGRSRRKSFGDATVLKVAWVRDLARELAVAVTRGRDPVADDEARRNEKTVNDLIERFDLCHIMYGGLKPSTAREYTRAIRNYIRPALGPKRISDVTSADVAKLFSSLFDKPTQANRTLEIISKMFNLAEEWGWRAPGTNPRRGIRKNPEKKRERFLSPAELARVGEVLCEMETERIEMQSAITAARLLILTGCRLNEIMTLQWRDVHAKSGFLRLRDAKTGPRDVPIGGPAIELLQHVPRLDGNPWVLAGRIEGGRLSDLQPFWGRVRARAGLKDVRIHDLRHTFASVAAQSGMTLLIIGKMLGHRTIQSTARYAHLATGTVRDAANDVASTIANQMGARLPGDKHWPDRVGAA